MSEMYGSASEYLRMIGCANCGKTWCLDYLPPHECVHPREQARLEMHRIQRELDNLGPEFVEDGIVRTVLRERIEQEKKKALE